MSDAHRKRARNALTRIFSRGLIGCVLLSQLAAAHEDHSSRHGGFVMMFLDLHFELVVPPEGGVALYYSDSMRMPMPAAVVSDVAIEIERADSGIESVLMRISDSGEAWEGDSNPVTQEDSIVRVAFLFQGEPFVLDIPYSVFPDPEEMDMEMDMDSEAELPCTDSCAG